MNHLLNDLNLRALDWMAHTPANGEKAVWKARGSAIGEHLRRFGAAGEALAERVEGRLMEHHSPGSGARSQAAKIAVDETVVAKVTDLARKSWTSLMSLLDSPDEGTEELEGTARQTFLDIFEALLIAEAGQREEAGQLLFNEVVREIYAFEPVAECAGAMRQKLIGTMGLADLFCAGVAGFAETDAPITRPAQVQRAAEEFVEVAELVMAGGAGAREMLTLEEVAKRLGRSAWYFVKWGTQRVRLIVEPMARALKVEVHEATGGLSRGMDGWEVQVRGAGHAVIRAGAANVKLAERVEAGKFVVEVRRAGESEWAGLFGKVSG